MLWLLACTENAPKDRPDPAAPSSPVPSSPTPTTPEPEPPLIENVMVVLLDDVAAEYVGTYGLREYAAPTPTLDGLAAEGVLFRNAWGTPLCSSARASLLT